MEVDEEAEDLVRSFESAEDPPPRPCHRPLDQCRNAARAGEFVIDQLRVTHEDVFELAVMVGLADLSQLITADRSDLLWRPFTARFPERIRDFQGDCLAAIRAKDILVHHPYESFDVVLQFLRQAADDPNVIAIKQTLYRTTPNSPIAALPRPRGHQPVAATELKARFDEEANIKLARDLNAPGCRWSLALWV